MKKYLGSLTKNKIPLEQFTTNYNNKLVDDIGEDENYIYDLLKVTHLIKNS